jgi:error-prone DNA polymerase
MVRRGYEPDFARRCFEQIKGFGEYGFPESHAASFAKLVYVSSWLKCHHPAVFACALLNSQPMGFYAPAQIVRDAREHDVEVQAGRHQYERRGTTRWREREDGTLALRLGFRNIDGFREEDWAGRDRSRPRAGGYDSLEGLVAAGGAWRLSALKKLADADAFRSLGLDRREALWAVRRLPDDDPMPLFAAAQRARTGRGCGRGAAQECRSPNMWSPTTRPPGCR